MSYHLSRSFKPPKTKKEKLEAGRQFIVTALIFGAIAFAYAGWVYWQQKEQAERRTVQAESSKANEELFRDLAKSQKKSAQQNPSPSPVNEPPTTKSYDSVRRWQTFVLPIVAGAVSLLMFCVGILYTVEARRMAETPENQERERRT